MNDLNKLQEMGVFLPDEDDALDTPAAGIIPEANSTPDTAVPPVVEEPVPPVVEEPVPPVVEEAPAVVEEEIEENKEEEQEDFQKPLSEISEITAKIDEAMEAGDVDLVVELMWQIKEKVNEGSEAIVKSDILRANTDEKNVKLLEDKLQLTQTLEGQKNIIEWVTADTKLRDLVILAADPTKQTEYQEALMEYAQEKLNVDIKSVIEQKKESERQAMAASDAAIVSTPNLWNSKELDQWIFLPEMDD
jgi:hypothetical protein